VLPSDDTCLVVVIDQFEELFTLAGDVTTKRFLDAIVEASSDDRRRIRFVITLRADFYDRPLAHPRFGSAMGAGIVNVVPMAPEELEQAASGPAMRAGVRLEPGLEAALIGDVLGEPGALPLFEFALTDLFDRRIGETLTLEAYRTMGGIDGAISRKAEHLYGGLTRDQQSAAEQVFLRLVSLSDGETRSRRRVDAAELLSLDLDVTDLQTVLDTFGSQRLILFDRNDATGSPTVEVSHEALLDQWDRLAGWIASATADLTTNARLTALATEWHDHGEDPAYLLSEGRFTDYSTWAETSTMTLAGPERHYLEASRLAHEDREHAEAARVEREAATARRARRNAWGLAAIVVVVVVVGGYLAWTLTRPEGPTIAFVHSGETSGFQRSMADGFTRAAELHDFEPVDYVLETDPREQLRAIAQTKPRAIIAPFDFILQISELAPEFPDVSFVVIDGEPFVEGANVYNVTFDDMHGGHLAGVVAGLSTTSGRVAFVGPGQFLWSEMVAQSFAAGVDLASDAKPQVGWISAGMVPHPAMGYIWDGWSQSDLAEALAGDLFSDGVDVVYAWAGQATEGIVRAAQTHEETTGEQVWVVAPDDDWQLLPGQESYILTSIIKRFDEAVVAAVESILSADPMESIELPLYQLGAGPIDELATRAESVLAAAPFDVVTDLDWSTVPYRWPETAATERVVAVTQTRCDLDDVGPVTSMEPIAFTIVNEADTSVMVGLAMVSASLSEGDRAQIGSNDSAWLEAMVAGLAMPTYSVTVPPGHSLELRSEFRDEGSGFGMGALQCFWNDDRASDPVYFEVISGS
jgi:basic membrane lipoprotein Med (substrate-binding protein (PBP1-ABC) superfamily)